MNRLTQRYIHRDIQDTLETFSDLPVYGLESNWLGNRQYHGAKSSRLMTGGIGAKKDPLNRSRPKQRTVHSISLLHTNFRGDRLYVQTHYDSQRVIRNARLEDSRIESFVQAERSLSGDERGIGASARRESFSQIKEDSLYLELTGQEDWKQQRVPVDGHERQFTTKSVGVTWIGFLEFDKVVLELWSHNFRAADVSLSLVTDLTVYFQRLMID